MTATIRVNGESRRWRAETVGDLLAGEGIAVDGGGLAVALNNNVIPRGAWATTRLQPDDRVEIVRIVRGG